MLTRHVCWQPCARPASPPPSTRALLPCRAGRVQEVLSVYAAMQDDECRPSTGTRALLMSTFVRADRCDLALQLFFDARLAGQPVTPDMQRGLICVASKVGRWPLALDLLDDLLATWTDTEERGQRSGELTEGGTPAGESSEERAPGVTSARAAAPDYVPMEDSISASEGAFEARQDQGSAAADLSSSKEVQFLAEAPLQPPVAAPTERPQNSLTAKQLGSAAAAAAGGASLYGKARGTEAESAWGEVLGAPNSSLPFNALISALARAGKWQIALSVFARMKKLGIPPDHFTWSGLASALARAGEFDRAMALFEYMGERERLEPTVVVCNCALLACQRKAKWQRALQLLWRMERMGVQADVRSYSMVIRTCELAGQSEAAMTVYQRMQKTGCKPNTFTLASLIRILGKTKDWQGAVKIFEDARSSGVPLNAHLFNALLEALLHNRQVAAARLYRVQMRRYRVVEDENTRAILKRAEQREVGWDAEWEEEVKEREKEKVREREREERERGEREKADREENEEGELGKDSVTWENEDDVWRLGKL
ncbi:hypothetical protein CLOM_g8926 [Closterium sp. NIES-68]|nr:hypothetical protein CLOM_g8926 [Closterium sp. NIES-68]GJP70150.1 hypothetical protein CLOP_g1128 [Closterium sp. NIES-67]